MKIAIVLITTLMLTGCATFYKHFRPPCESVPAEERLLCEAAAGMKAAPWVIWL